jgi:YkoY family integral membrane protein
MEVSGISISLHTVFILLALVVLETVLSADNAVALAAFVQPMQDPKQQRLALNWGLVAAFILRIALLFTATWIAHYWQFEFVGALYLLWLAGKHFWQQYGTQEAINGDTLPTQVAPTLWNVIPLIALTDLAFSLDSVTTAVAISDQLWLVLTGCIIGIITLRFLAGLFVSWLEEFTYLQNAAYLTVLGVGLKLLCKALQPDLVPPDWTILAMIGVLFTWGFSKRTTGDASIETPEEIWLQTPALDRNRQPRDRYI